VNLFIKEMEPGERDATGTGLSPHPPSPLRGFRMLPDASHISASPCHWKCTANRRLYRLIAAEYVPVFISTPWVMLHLLLLLLLLLLR